MKHIWVKHKDYEIEYCKVCNVVKYTNPKFIWVNDKDCTGKPIPEQHLNVFKRSNKPTGE